MTMKLRPAKSLPLCVLALVIAAHGCGGGGGGGSKPEVPTTAEEFTQRGWSRFETGNYDGALSDFEDALALDSSYGQAYLGQGWAQLNLATTSASMELATAAFDSAVAHDEPLADCLSGRAAAYLGVGGNPAYISSISDVILALQVSPDFTFSHRSSFNSTDLELIKAFAFAAQGHFPAALSAANEISSSGIAQENPETWVVEGKEYSSFEGALLAFLQKLSDEHAG